MEARAGLKGPNLNHPTRRESKLRAGKRSQILLQGRKVGAAQAPARTHTARRPLLAPQSLAPERATLKQAPSGNSTDIIAQRPHRAPGRFPASHYPAAMQRPARKPYNNPRLHTRTLHPRDPTTLTGPCQQAAHSQPVPTPDPCAQGGSRGSRGWPGRRRSKTTTTKTTPQDPEH